MRRWLWLLLLVVALVPLRVVGFTPPAEVGAQEMGTLVVTVSVEGGLPVPNTQVFFVSAASAWPVPVTSTVRSLTQQDSDGRFRRSLPAGHYFVGLTNTDLRLANDGALRIPLTPVGISVAGLPLEIRAGETMELNLLVTRASALAPGCRFSITPPSGALGPARAMFEASLSPSEVVPLAEGAVRGVARFVAHGTHVLYDVSVHGVSEALVTGAYLYRARPGEPGEIICTLSPEGFTHVSGQVDRIDSDLLAGNLFVQVHTHANPDGAARGQLLRDEAREAEATRAAHAFLREIWCRLHEEVAGRRTVIFPPTAGRGQLEIDLPAGLFRIAEGNIVTEGPEGTIPFVRVCYTAGLSQVMFRIPTGEALQRESFTPEGEAILHQIRARPVGGIRPPDTGSAGLR